MMTPLLCESPERRHPQEKCASKCVRSTCLAAFICFLTQEISDLKSKISDLKSEISDLKFEISNLHAWLSSKSTRL